MQVFDWEKKKAELYTNSIVHVVKHAMWGQQPVTENT